MFFLFLSFLEKNVILEALHVLVILKKNLKLKTGVLSYRKNLIFRSSRFSLYK
jgi:hypothetical protein